MSGLGWGILGAGGIARIFARDLRTAGLRVVTVGSRAADTAEALGRELDVPHRHASQKALCDDPEFDVVYVATPHQLHRDNGARDDGPSAKSPIMSHEATIEVMEIMDAIRTRIGVRYPNE